MSNKSKAKAVEFEDADKKEPMKIVDGDVEDAERQKFYYDKDGVFVDSDGEYNYKGESIEEVRGIRNEEWANPLGDYASYGSFGGAYN